MCAETSKLEYKGMNMRTMARTKWMACGVLVFLASATGAGGSIITYDLDYLFNPSGSPPAVPPWLTVTIDDGGTAGSVTLTLAATNLTGTEFVSGWYLNLDPDLDPTALVFSEPTKTGLFDVDSIDTGVDAYKADGDGNFDILLSFGTSNAGGGTKRFGVAEAVEYTITGISTLTAGSFDFDSQGLSGGLPTAAQVQSVGWITQLPEPATLALVALGAGALALGRRRK